MALCELTEMEQDFCSHCKEKEPRPAFKAEFDSPCPTCGATLEKGQMAVWRLDGTSAEHAYHAR